MRMKYTIGFAVVFNDLLLCIGIYNSYKEIQHLYYRATETGSRLDCEEIQHRVESDGSLQSPQYNPSSFIQYSVWRQVQSLLQDDASI